MRLALPRRRPVHDTEVTAVTPLTSSITRLTLAGPSLPALGIEHPTQWVKLAIPSPDGDGSGEVSRAYTIRHHRPEQAEVDIDIVLHGNGPLARWAATARPGARARIAGPRGRLRPLAGEDYLLLAADESAQPAALSILEQLPSGFPAFAFFEIADPADTQPVTTTNAQLTWLPRPTGHPKGRLLTEALLSTTLPPGRPAAWVAGESTAVAAIRRRLLTERHLTRESLQAKGYWKSGEADHKDRDGK
ncbi:siderophore-interacting protein [Kitasatospora sp. NPDC050543]|uniref:siderophore-interacting protein n=1 Tax=Kitasatospora sp. NPDC050543 TaxID=3364054 RepID=UPI0037AD68D9